MKKLLILLAFTAFFGNAHAQSDNDRRVIFIMLDGLRWQELFNGADTALINVKRYAVNPKGISALYWRPTQDERRMALMPFTWGYVKQHGLIIGNRWKNSFMQVENKYKFSYPGYSETFCGWADDERINSNDDIPNPNINVLEIANTLYDEGALEDKDKFLELCNSDQFDDDFSFIKAIDNKADRYYKLEGYLYPDKYDFYLNEEPESVIYIFLNNYESKMNEKQEFSGYDKTYTINQMIEESGTSYSLDEIMRIASIIQAEAADKDDMYYISSILHNRLSADESMGVSNLGLDSTKYYPYRSAVDIPSNVGSDYVSKYETYDKAGLPAGSICNPGMDAIKAAILPKETDYYFFCHDKDGQAYYATTLYGHNQNLEKISNDDE